MSEYKNYHVRSDGRLEKKCDCGVWHTIAVLPEHENDQSWWLHDCCAKKCCEKFKGLGQKV